MQHEVIVYNSPFEAAFFAWFSENPGTVIAICVTFLVCCLVGAYVKSRR